LSYFGKLGLRRKPIVEFVTGSEAALLGYEIRCKRDPDLMLGRSRFGVHGRKLRGIRIRRRFSDGPANWQRQALACASLHLR